MDHLPINRPETFGEATPAEGTLTHLNLLELAPPSDASRPRPGVRRVLTADGVNLILFSFLPGQSLPDHKAAHPITVQCLAGEVTFGFEGQSAAVTPGTVIHLPAYAPHRVDCPAEKNKGDAPAVMLIMMHTGENPRQ
ncbi:cupin domain-containing protein [Corynebacterium sp. 32222D000BW]